MHVRRQLKLEALRRLQQANVAGNIDVDRVMPLADGLDSSVFPFVNVTIEEETIERETGNALARVAELQVQCVVRDPSDPMPKLDELIEKVEIALGSSLLENTLLNIAGIETELVPPDTDAAYGEAVMTFAATYYTANGNPSEVC